MTSTLLLLVLPLVADQTEKTRKPNPLAPSLPLLTKEEYDAFDKIIDRFIDYDTGKLKGPEGKKALREFQQLGPEAVFQIIDGFNRAANMEHSCPAVIIARKLSSILRTSDDLQLLSFAKENIGLDVTAKRHVNVVKDLKLTAQLRRAAVQQRLIAGGNKKLPDGGGISATKLSSMTMKELATAAAKERGQSLKNVLAEIQKRKGWGEELIGLLDGSDKKVSQAARQALVQISGGADYGPAASASEQERAEAIRNWREWLSKRNGK